MTRNEAITHLIRKSVLDAAALPPLQTEAVIRITNPGMRFRMAAYDATHVAPRGIIADVSL